MFCRGTRSHEKCRWALYAVFPAPSLSLVQTLEIRKYFKIRDFLCVKFHHRHHVDVHGSVSLTPHSHPTRSIMSHIIVDVFARAHALSLQVCTGVCFGDYFTNTVIVRIKSGVDNGTMALFIQKVCCSLLSPKQCRS